VNQLLLHRRRHHHHLVAAVPARLHHPADPDLAGEAVLLPLLVALEQGVEGVERRQRNQARRRAVIHQRQIVPAGEARAARRLDRGMGRKSVAILLGQPQFELDHPLLLGGQSPLLQVVIQGSQGIHRCTAPVRC